MFSSVQTEFVCFPSGTPYSDVSADARCSLNHTASAPVLLILHGFKAFARWGFFPYFGEYFADKGFLTLTVNFSLNGTPHRINADSEECSEPENFARNTISQEVRDAETMVRAVVEGKFDAQAPIFAEQLRTRWNGDIFLLAHSRGGASAWVLGERFKEVKKIAALGTIARLDRFTDRAKQEWRKNGFFAVQNARTGQELRIDAGYLDDIAENASRLEPLQTIKRLRQALLLVHGDQDLTVPIAEAETLYGAAQKAKCNVHWETIPQAAHTFGISHPMTAEQAAKPAFVQTLSLLEKFFYE
ncbi:MAG: prolyl oligopeptidase family serine peptidase [Candidatus Kapabacteria bacterium]|nr:prolyl oligopeptidase family serine peptidase [Candidatus Kapabacteria bacterium]